MITLRVKLNVEIKVQYVHKATKSDFMFLYSSFLSAFLPVAIITFDFQSICNGKALSFPAQFYLDIFCFSRFNVRGDGFYGVRFLMRCSICILKSEDYFVLDGICWRQD